MATREERRKIEAAYEAELKREGKYPGPYKREQEILRSIEMKGAVGALGVVGFSFAMARYAKSRVMIPVGLLGGVVFLRTYSRIHEVLSFPRIAESDRSKAAEISCPDILALANKEAQQNPQAAKPFIESLHVQSCLNYFKRKQQFQRPGVDAPPGELSVNQPSSSTSWQDPPPLSWSNAPDSTPASGQFSSSTSSFSPTLSDTPDPNAFSATPAQTSDGLLRSRVERSAKLTKRQVEAQLYKQRMLQKEQEDLEEFHDEEDVDPNSKKALTSDEEQIARWNAMYEKRHRKIAG